MKKVAVLVSGGGTNLQALIDAQKSGILKSGEITLVLSSKSDAYALERAENNGIKTCVIERSEHPDREEFSRLIAEALAKEDIDYIVFAGFMYILSGEFLEIYRNRMLNVHPALIPSFCGEGFYGLRVHKAVLERGVKLTGATVHFVNEVCDGGPIIMQKAVAIEEGDTPEILQKRVMEQAEWQILPEALELVCAGRVTCDGNVTHIN
ncbi:MAG: phosphoribosylglycinamide formyltransferase [Clostridia bacterium]|nr:phosphoribosylglycinamide formyltransferase [Clostridia bacterium]MBQ4575545.1 phosphoribosylglycinamide formyltransferase [Clostridia bacterium]